MNGEALRDAVRSLDSSLTPLVAYTRGGIPESVHRGVAVETDGRGRVVWAVGDPEVHVHLRSAAKPFQALALIRSGAAADIPLSLEEIAVVCGSHSGEESHTAVVEGLLSRLGLSSDDLVCGSHPPIGRNAREALRRRGEVPGPLHHTCSGKHAGMLALAAHLGLPPDGYAEPDHPVQRYIAEIVGDLIEEKPERLFDGTDGCGVPVLRTTARQGARLFALMAEGKAAGLDALWRAMTAHPEMVAGDGRLDTRLMQILSGRGAAKSGAEAVLGLGLRLVDGSTVGALVKVEDGGGRAVPHLVRGTLDARGETEAAALLENEWSTDISTTAGRTAGRVEMLTAPRGEKV